MDNQLSRFYLVCKEGKTNDVEKILKDDLGDLSEDEIKYVGKWGIIIACKYGHGRNFPMFGEIPYTGQWLTEKFIPDAKCLHESFLESRRFVKSTDKFDHVNPSNEYMRNVEYNVTLGDPLSCLLKNCEEISIRPEVKSRCDDFLKSHSRSEPFEVTTDEIFDKYVEKDHIVFEHRPCRLVDKSNRTEVRCYDGQDPDHYYKFSVNRHLDLHFERVPYGDKLRKLVEKHNFNRIKIVEESLICLTDREHILRYGDNMALYFVVKSKIEDIMTVDETAVFISKLSVEDQTEIAHQLYQLIFLSGFGDGSLDNLRIDKDSKKLVIIDTEPWKDVGFCLPKCLPIFHEVASAYGIYF